MASNKALAPFREAAGGIAFALLMAALAPVAALVYAIAKLKDY